MGYVFGGDESIWYFTPDYHIHKMWWTGSSYSTEDVTADAGVPAGITWSPLVGNANGSQATVFYIASTGGGQAYEVYWNGSKWLNYNIGLVGAPPNPYPSLNFPKMAAGVF